MSALLVKDPPEGLHDWLKAEARCNRRSLNQQVLICLEWCMRTYGKAQFRDPFAQVEGQRPATRFLRGAKLAESLRGLDGIDEDLAAQMKRDARGLRAAKGREYDYACFD